MTRPSRLNVGNSTRADSSVTGLAGPPVADTIQTRPPRMVCAVRATNTISFPPFTQVGSLTDGSDKPVIERSRVTPESTSSNTIVTRALLLASGGMARVNAIVRPSGDHAAFPS